VFLEEQVEILHEKMEGLEGELRYAWRALDVLSQEYVKMWQRLEKMEGLLSEQQTVITQLIDLYSVESSDTAPENGKSGAPSPTSPQGDGIMVSLRHQAVPDENFYKALNVIHGDANTEMRLGDDQSHEDDEDDDSAAGGKIIFPPGQSPRLKGKGVFVNAFESNVKRRSGKNGGNRRRGSQGDSDDAKSIASTVSTVRSEGVGEFPLPSDLSPAGYENMTPPSKPPSPPKKSVVSESKKKKKKTSEQKIVDNSVQPPPPIGPLQLIGGRYSFSLMDANGDGPIMFRGGAIQQQQQQQQQMQKGDNNQGRESPLRSPQVANGKPLFPSLQTAMVTPKEATDGQKDNGRKSLKGVSKKEEKKDKKKSRKESKERDRESSQATVKKEQPKPKVKVKEKLDHSFIFVTKNFVLEECK
jgi:hypothetical protein